MRRTFRFRSMTVALALLALAPFSSATAQQRGRTNNAQTPSLSDTEALATVLAALNRHARPADRTSDLDQQLTASLKKVSKSRDVAQQLIGQFNTLPADARQKLFGAGGKVPSGDVSSEQFVAALRKITAKRRNEGEFLKREPSEAALDASRLNSKGREQESEEENPGGNAPRVRRPMGSWNAWPAGAFGPGASLFGVLAAPRRVPTLEYTGLYCREETDWDQGSASDEIYIVTSVYVFGGAPNTIKHPSSANYYRSIDTGDKRIGPVAECWSGAATGLCLVTTVFEQDSSDRRSSADMRRTVDMLMGLAAFGAALGGDDPCVSGPELIAAVLGGAIEDLPGVDDVISSIGQNISQDQLEDYAAADEQESRGIEYDFLTYHRGQGARFRVYFRVQD